MAVSVNVCIVLKGEEYSIVEIPPQSSAIVRKQKEGLLQQVDMKAFVEDLGRVGGFVRVAYNGATAAGPHFKDLQVKIQKIGFEVADLCDTSAITVAKFQDASASILDDLQSTYEYLTENETDMALDIFKGIVKVAGEMHKAATNLQKKFEEEKKKVEDTVTETIEKRGATSKEAEQKKIQRAELEKQQKNQQEELERIVKTEEDAMEMFKHARDSQDEALKDMGNVGLWGTLIGKRKAHEKRADEMKEQRKEALKVMDQQREVRQKVLADIGEAAKKLINCSEEKENMDIAAVEALHQAEAGLRSLSIVMRQAAVFWKHMEEHCSQLSDPRVAREFKAIGEKSSEDDRIKLFSSKPFKRGAVEFYARWVALNVVCTDYMDNIKQTQRKLYSYIRECPTYDRAKHDISDLAKEFLADVETAQQELAQKRREGEEERKELEAPVSTA